MKSRRFLLLIILLVLAVAVGGCGFKPRIIGHDNEPLGRGKKVVVPLPQSCALPDNATVCIDGNTKGGDGCSPTCEVEAGWRCAYDEQIKVGSCVPECGDGILKGDEQCDPGGGRRSWDESKTGCSHSCRFEKGWLCDTLSGKCQDPVCGDGIVAQGTEECDTGNPSDPNDGCTSDCKIERNRNWECSSFAGVPDRLYVPVTYRMYPRELLSFLGKELQDRNIKPVSLPLFDKGDKGEKLKRNIANGDNISQWAPYMNVEGKEFNPDDPSCRNTQGYQQSCNVIKAFQKLFDPEHFSTSDHFSIPVQPLAKLEEPYIFTSSNKQRTINRFFLSDAETDQEALLNEAKATPPAADNSVVTSRHLIVSNDQSYEVDPFGARCLNTAGRANYSFQMQPPYNVSDVPYLSTEQSFTATMHLKFYYFGAQTLSFGAGQNSELFVYINHKLAFHKKRDVDADGEDSKDVQLLPIKIVKVDLENGNEVSSDNLKGNEVPIGVEDGPEEDKFGLIEGKIYDLDIFFINYGYKMCHFPQLFGPGRDDWCNKGAPTKAHLQISVPGILIGPSYCFKCGDGVVQAGEACDDGNSINGDGCNDSCQIEPGNKCLPSYLGPSVCNRNPKNYCKNN